jgi:hypothetical protein
MRRRLYFLLPDLPSARKTMDDLLLARIDEGHIHFIGPQDADMSGLHPANVLQSSDLIPAAQHGLVIGGGIGILAGLAAAMYPIVGDTPQWGAVAVLAILGGAFGAWASSMIGVSIPSSRLKRFEAATRRGEFLVMVDVPRSRIAEIEELLRAAHPEAHFEGVEPDIPAFP